VSTSAGVASDFWVGLDSGGTIGAGVRAAISRITGSVKAPGVADVLIRIVGAICRTTVSRS
jgi:hypothetical protein